jgi:hypothetical protein
MVLIGMREALARSMLCPVVDWPWCDEVAVVIRRAWVRIGEDDGEEENEEATERDAKDLVIVLPACRAPITD